MILVTTKITQNSVASLLEKTRTKLRKTFGDIYKGIDKLKC